MRVGIFGGTFDPVHLAHLVVAEQSREQAELAEVWFVPAFQPPHKASTELTPFDRRVEMLQLALAGRTDMRVEPLEKELPTPSYTAQTLAELQRRHPDAELHLIVGADCLPEMHGWHQPTRILQLATLLVCARPSYPLWSAQQLADSLGMEAAQVRLRTVELPVIDLASHALRSRVAAGRSVKYLVPHAVEVFIREKSLYCGPRGGRS